jgi:hypothetical protein
LSIIQAIKGKSMPVEPIREGFISESSSTFASESSEFQTAMAAGVRSTYRSRDVIIPKEKAARESSSTSTSTTSEPAEFQSPIAADVQSTHGSREALAPRGERPEVRRYGKAPALAPRPSTLKKTNRSGGNPETLLPLPRRVTPYRVRDPETGMVTFNLHERKPSGASIVINEVAEAKGISKTAAAFRVGAKAVASGHLPTKAGINKMVSELHGKNAK